MAVWGHNVVYFLFPTFSVQFSHSVVSSLHDPMNYSTPGLPVHHQLPKSTQTHVHWVSVPSNHLILFRPFLLLPSIFPSIRAFSNESALHIRWPKYWRLSFNISPSSEHQGLISFRMDWLKLLAVQGTWALGKCLLEIKYGFLFLVSYHAWWLSS